MKVKSNGPSLKQIDLKIYVKPNAKQSALVAVKDQVLHIALHAKPQEGEANAELIRFLSELLQIPKTQLILQRGQKSRYKTVRVTHNEIVKKLLSE